MSNRISMILAAHLVAIASFAAHADTLSLGEQTSASAPSKLPRKGELQAAVVHEFGEPRRRHAAVGGDSPHHPPIVRWDYAEFSVFFENSHVVDAVVPGHPAPLYNTEKLTPTKR